VAKVDPGLAGTFRHNVEEKLERATLKNSSLILRWELSDTFDRADLVCDETVFNQQVIEHVATSLIRLLSVGKKLGVVDRKLDKFTMQCWPQDSKNPLFRRSYQLE